MLNRIFPLVTPFHSLSKKDEQKDSAYSATRNTMCWCKKWSAWLKSKIVSSGFYPPIIRVFLAGSHSLEASKILTNLLTRLKHILGVYIGEKTSREACGMGGRWPITEPAIWRACETAGGRSGLRSRSSWSLLFFFSLLNNLPCFIHKSMPYLL